MLHRNCLLILSPACFAVCGHHLPPRIAIVFSLLSKVYQTLPCHIRLMSSSPLLAHPVPPCIPDSPINIMCVLLHIVVPHGHMCASTSSSSRLLVGPGPLHKIAVSAFSRSPSGRADTFSFQYLPQPPHVSKCFSFFTLFLSASLSLSSIVHFASVSCTRQISLWTVPLLGFLNPSIFSRLRYPILFQLAIFLFSPIQPYQLWLATSFLAYSLL